MAKVRFRDYGQYCDYVKVEAKKLDLALPAEILDIPCVKAEIERLKLTTWEYKNRNATCKGTFYWNDNEKAWKYYERSEMCDVLDGGDEAEGVKILEAYLGEPANWDDDFPEFTEYTDDEDE